MANLEPPLPRKERRAHRRPLPLPEVKFVPAGNPSLPTFVSLMLMITTFMIVLTSISLHENTRMRALMTGVRETFAVAPGNAETGAEAVTQTKLLGEVASGFRQAVPLAVVETEAGGNRLMLIMPVSAALDTTTRTATPEYENGMRAMAAALSKKSAEFDHELELRFSDAALGAAYAGIVATIAAKRGIDPAQLFVGTGPGPKDTLSLLVRLEPVPAAGGGQ